MPPKSTFKGVSLWGINERGVGHCNKKKETKKNLSSCVRMKQTKQNKMDKTGKQQQKRTELYKFKRNSLIPD